MMKRIVIPKNHKAIKALLLSALMVFFCLFSVSAQTPARAPIDVNLIIDGSISLTSVKDEILVWVSGRLDQILVEGDRVTVWNTGPVARIIYSDNMDSTAEIEAVRRSIQEISPSGDNTDFSGALMEAAGRQSSPFSYTLLISASPDALSSVLSSPQANLLRFSRVEEFPEWRALVVGLNLDTRVRRAAAAFFNAQ
jgi:hypothetical protein